MKSLIGPAIRTLLLGSIALAILLFLPAGTLAYWQAWVFIVVFMISVNTIGIYLTLNDPELLERRKKVGPTAETRVTQKIIASVLFGGFFALMVVSALDHRFGWTQVPPGVSIVGDALVVLGLFITLLVLKENSYSASTIQTVEGQKVISTGPYAIVRHPMYVGALILAIGVPLALGSWWALAILVPMMLVLAWRILDEESFLKKDLPGYADYTRKVRYRLAPHLW